MTTARDEFVELRQAMVEQLRALDAVRSDAVETAFRAVPRHLFAPGAEPEHVYDATATVWPKHDGSGRMVSTVSAAHIQAVQLEQADVRPGMRVLEIGSGGYNAALLAALVGPEGEVVSVDIDPEIVARARACLDAAGVARVRTVTADGDAGVPEHGPYDRIVVTVRSWDIPPGWVAQLVPGGRIVVPLRLGPLTRTIALDRPHNDSEGEHVLLTGGDVRLCAFVPMQGAGAHEDRIGLLPDTTGHGGAGEDGQGPGRVQLRADGPAGDGPAGDMAGVMASIGATISGPMRRRPVTTWTGVEFDHVDDLDLWLTLRLPAAGILTADRELTDLDRPTALTRAGAPTLVTDGGFAYRTKRPTPPAATSAKAESDRAVEPAPEVFETGVLAWGPDATDLADHYARTVAEWGRYRTAGGRGPQIQVVAAGTPLQPTAQQRVLDKNHTHIVVSWPIPEPIPSDLTDPATDSAPSRR